MAAVIKKGDTLDDVVAKINREIDSRRTYGIRRDCAPEDTDMRKASVLFWSNGNCRWYVTEPPTATIRCRDGSPELKEAVDTLNELIDSCAYLWKDLDEFVNRRARFEEIKEREKADCRAVTSRCQCLDANEVLVVGAKRDLLKALADARILETLPLYHGSVEARTRGDFCLIGIEVPPPLRNIPVDQMDKETLRALTEHLLGAPVETAEEAEE